MGDFYARIVLRIIGPALKLRDQHTSAKVALVFEVTKNAARNTPNPQQHPASAVPPHLVVPASRIDIDALLATTGWISPAAQRSPPVGRLASMFSALRRLLSLHRDRRGRGASQ